MKTRLLLASLFLSMAGLSAQTYQVPVSEQDEPMMKGKFEPTWSSLENYQVPEWFRNVKFGIWAHWGPQCVEGSGDWMARSMYMEGTREYEYHVKHYGHPSEVGFKDIIPLWKAENWDPDKLVAFYKKIGAQYFFAYGIQHAPPVQSSSHRHQRTFGNHLLEGLADRFAQRTNPPYEFQ